MQRNPGPDGLRDVFGSSSIFSLLMLESSRFGTDVGRYRTFSVRLGQRRRKAKATSMAAKPLPSS